MKGLLFIFPVASLMLLCACGGSDKSDTRIGPEGGTVDGPDGVVLDIPAEALDGEVEISITEVDGSPTGFRPAGGAYEFGPTGTVFKVPVTVTLPYEPGQLLYGESGVRAWWADSLDGSWSALTGEVDTSTRTVTGSTATLGFGASGEREDPDVDAD